MTKIISFAWTTPALLARRKTVTRRDWSPNYAARFHMGDLVTAYGRSPRHGGRPVATIRLTQEPYLGNTKDVPPEDYEREGFAYLESIGAQIDGATPQSLWHYWQEINQRLWVIRFEIVSIP